MESVYLFVYGTLKRGYGNNYILGKSEFCLKHVTEPIYTMATNGGFPIVKREGTTAITGEVYKVTDPNILKRVYGLEGYSGTPGAKDNWYDIDTIKVSKNITANIFVMDKDKYPHLQTIESGVF